MLSTIPLIHVRPDGHDVLIRNLWLTGMVGFAALVILAVTVYLIAAKKPDGDTVTGGLVFGMFGAAAWPAVLAVGAVTGFIMAMRWLVHDASKPALSKAARAKKTIQSRDKRIAELEAKNAKLESELGL